MADLEFFVPGIPAPKGSLKALKTKFMKHAILKEGNADKVRPWMASIALAARDAGATPEDGPVLSELEFVVPRPKGHFNAKGLLKDSAPAFPDRKPDVDKLTRAALDALTGVAWEDDARVVDLGGTRKRFAMAGEPTGLRVRLTRFPRTVGEMKARVAEAGGIA